MEMEHINENTIRVLIGTEDLAARGITFLDLLGNHKEIENFFYSILEEVDVEEEFQGSESVTFQVLPKGDGLELFISKNMMIDDANFEEYADMNAEEVGEFIRKQMLQDFDEEPEELDFDEDREIIFEMNDIEEMIQLAHSVYLRSAVTNLYSVQNKYYLHVVFLMDELTDGEVANEKAQLLEYAQLSSVTPETLVEYGNCLMERNALELTRFYFK